MDTLLQAHNNPQFRLHEPKQWFRKIVYSPANYFIDILLS